MKIFVTGASGYVGNKLVHSLTSEGHIVHALVRSLSAEQLLRGSEIKLFKGDLLDKKSISVAMEGCTHVYHTAAISKLWVKKPETFYEQNVAGTENVLQAAMRNEIQKLVYTSSCGVWSASKNHLFTENDPRVSSFDNDYDLSKYLAERLVRRYSQKGLNAVIVNPARIYGPGLNRNSSGVNRFVDMLLRSRINLLPWRLEASSSYSFIDDVVNGHILAMEKGASGERYILGGENISYRRFIELFQIISGTRKIALRIPSWMLRSWGFIEMMRGKFSDHDPLLVPAMVRRFNLDKTFDCSKAVKQLGYVITPFELGLQRTIEHLQKMRTWKIQNRLIH